MNTRDPMNGHPLVVLLIGGGAFVGLYMPNTMFNALFECYLVIAFFAHLGLCMWRWHAKRLP